MGNYVKGEDLIKIIKQCINKLTDIDLISVAIFCDQGTQNRKMFDLLGGSLLNQTTKVNDKEILLKYIKNK